jgi:hypothetical protein
MRSHGKASPYWGAVLIFAAILVAGYTEAAERAANGMGAVTERATNAESIEARRMRLLAMLTSPKMLEGDIDSGSYAYRRRWQHYHACLEQGVRTAEANRYFAESDEIVADEWPVLLQIRTYFAFKDTVLSPAARERLAEVMLDYKKNFHRSRNIEQYGTNGNHSIVNFSMYLLLDEAFGNGSKHDVVRDKFIKWVRYQGRFGRDEVNSPHYLERSLLPLLNLYDFTKNATLKLWAQMAIDQMMADFAVLSLDNVRGGPWCRAHHNHAPGVQEISDGTQDSFYVIGYLFFGYSAFPAYPFTDQILSYGFITTTSYRPPPVVAEMADRRMRGSYTFKSHQRSVHSEPSPGPVDWDMYYYLTPRYSLGSLQNRVELDNHVTGRITRDYKNTQVWELTFADPLKILGPTRELRVSTGEEKKVVEERNPNTANMQYKNVLFYKGALMDYNGNLAAGGGAYTTGKQGERQFRFWQVPTPDGNVFVGVTHYPEASAGILEVASDQSHRPFAAFQRDVRDNPSSCRDTGLHTTYVSTLGDSIVYQCGRATVNGKPWPLKDYALYESPYVNSAHGSGLIILGNARIGTLTLDFRDPEKPIRVGEGPKP